MSYSVTLSHLENPTEQSVLDWCRVIKARPSSISVNGLIVRITLPRNDEGEIDLDRIERGAMKDFATLYRLKTDLEIYRLSKAEAKRYKQSEIQQGEMVVRGKRGNLFFYGNWPGEASVQIMAVLFDSDPHGNKEQARRQWENNKKLLTGAGCTITIDADGEGIARLDPLNQAQVAAAMRVARVRPKRQVSPDVILRLKSTPQEVL